MNIILIEHATERAIQRGTTRDEILRVVEEGIEVLSASEHIDLSFLLPVEIRKEALR